MANGREYENENNHNKICMIYKRGAAWQRSLHRVAHGLSTILCLCIWLTASAECVCLHNAYQNCVKPLNRSIWTVVYLYAVRNCCCFPTVANVLLLMDHDTECHRVEMKWPNDSRKITLKRISNACLHSHLLALFSSCKFGHFEAYWRRLCVPTSKTVVKCTHTFIRMLNRYDYAGLLTWPVVSTLCRWCVHKAGK